MATPPQQVYSDRYEPVRLVARGGMAEVWLARDGLLDRMVALKVLFPELSVDPNFVERFRREAQAAANLSHPNIVSVYDWGEAGGTYFIVMEYVEGRPLSAVLREEGPLLADRTAAIGADVAAALGFAHRNGVIHRDVKPGNVLISSLDHVKVTDFGIARALNTEDHLTQTGAVMGTATYFSPEQAQGLPVDQRSDVYALGVVLFEMVTGQPPFVADGPVAVAYKHVHEEPAPPTQIVPEIPGAFEAIVLQALAKDIAQRYGSAEELRADLLRFRQGRPVLAEPPPAARVGRRAGDAGAPGLAGAGLAGAGVAGAGAAGAAATARGGAEAVGAGGAAAAAGAGAGRSERGQDRGPTRVIAPIAATTVTAIPGGPAVVEPEEPRRRSSTRSLGLLLAVLVTALLLVLVLLSRQLGLFGGTSTGTGSPPRAAAAGPVTVPADLVGKTYAAAMAELLPLGVQVQRVDVAAGQQAPNTVVTTNPAPGQAVPPGGVLQLDIASATPLINEPDVIGLDAATATQQLQQAGFTLGPQQAQSSATVPAGQVISANPPAGSQGHRGDVVTLTVSSGRGMVLVPDETGKDQATATNDLTKAGFRVIVGSQQTSPTVPVGTVIKTDPAAGTSLLQGSVISLTISAGPAKVRVPYVLNYTEANARADIEAKGLVVAETMQPVSSSDQDGRVLTQSPGAGVTVDQGSTVSITVGQFSGSTSTSTTSTTTLIP